MFRKSENTENSAGGVGFDPPRGKSGVTEIFSSKSPITPLHGATALSASCAPQKVRKIQERPGLSFHAFKRKIEKIGGGSDLTPPR